MSSAVSDPGATSTTITRRELNPRQIETVERLFAAGLDELRTVGFEGLTIRSVAGRAGVAPATAYTYFSSKNHLVAEIFWRRLAERPRLELAKSSPLERVVAVFDDLTDFLSHAPELAGAVTVALLGPEPDVMHLRIMIGTEINARIVDALGPNASLAVVDAMSVLWSGALLQAGMGHARVDHLGNRLASAARLLLTESTA
jgi:AcrR family transcriptional regulator